MESRKLEERFIKLSISIINEMKKYYQAAGVEHLYRQITRSASSAALNYSEALCAETPRDFAHKLSVSLKELRETYTNLRIVSGIHSPISSASLNGYIEECSQLIAILTPSIKTLKGNLSKKENQDCRSNLPESGSDSKSP